MTSYPSFTKAVHTKTYPTISPARPELSCKSKTIIITGAGYPKPGATTAFSFAEAGATSIGLIDNTPSSLHETETRLKSTHPNIKIYTHVCDLTSPESVGVAAHHTRVELGAWDIFINTATHTEKPRRINANDLDDWWTAFEVNVKFLANWSKHFLTKARSIVDGTATFINVSPAACHLPDSTATGLSAHCASTLAATKILEFIAVENPGLRVFTVHPGVLETPPLIQRKAVRAEKDEELSRSSTIVELDDVKLQADFCVWCTSSESEHLRGRYVWCNWDVDEMMDQTKKDELEANPGLLRMQMGM